MRIGVIGSGDVGRVLAAGFLWHGNEVTIGSRDPGKLEDFAKEHAGMQTGTFEQVASFGEIVVLATSWDGALHALELAGAKNLEGKIVIDVTNPLAFGDGTIGLAVSGSDSAGERVQNALPQSHVVKAFNTIGNGLMVDPKIEGGPPTMMICGNDDDAKKTVTGLIEDFGSKDQVIDMGGIEMSRYLEAMAILWIAYAMRNKSHNHAFKLLRG